MSKKEQEEYFDYQDIYKYSKDTISYLFKKNYNLDKLDL